MKRTSHNTQLDAHCWKYFQIKYNCDYLVQNRERVYKNDIKSEIIIENQKRGKIQKKR